MDNMATMHEKLVDMLSTIREIRKEFKKTARVRPYRLADQIIGMFGEKSEISQHELFQKFPQISPRTMRRHLQELRDQEVLDTKKNGREVFYAKHGHLSTKPSID